MTTTTQTFGAGQSIIDVTEHYDSEQWHEYGDGLSSGYKHMHCLEEVASDGPWFSRYEGSGHLLGLYRDSDGDFWELRFNEAENAEKLHFIGNRNAVLTLAAEYSVRVWDDAMSCKWLILNDEAIIPEDTGGIPASVIREATDLVVEQMEQNKPHRIIEQDVAMLFAGEDEEGHTPNCEIKNLN
jgi:hypothetical protein